jgi:hypothetical protein
MSGELPFIDIDGVEIANGYRTLEYLRRGLGGTNWEVPEIYPCNVLAREVGGIGPFTSPSADPAPWYDSTIPESAEFLGLISKLDFQTLGIKRNISQRFGNLGGGVIGIEQFAARNLHVDGLLVAATCPGLEYGRHWLYSRLGGDCIGCTMRTIRVRESCPPTDGSNDPRGERIMYEGALVEGIKRNDNGGWNCCDYDGIEFDIASQSPYLYSRPGSGTVAANYQSSGSSVFPPVVPGGIAPVPPALLDSGTRANTGPPPSASWTSSPVTGLGAQLKIISNQFAITPGAVSGGAYWNPGTFAVDQAAMATLGTRGDNFGAGMWLLGRVVTPGIGTGTCVFMKLAFGSTSDFITMGRITTSGQLITVFTVPSGFTAVVGDRYMLTCRGNLIEAWRQPSGGAWIHLGAFYDPVTPTAGYVGLGISEAGTSAGATNFSGAAIGTNGALFPKEVLTFPMAAVPVGIVSPIVTLVQPGYGTVSSQNSSNGVRVQLKTGSVDCYQQDDFSVDTIASGRWNWPTGQTGNFAITGGKLKPTVTGILSGSGRRLFRKTDSQGKTLAFYGGRVQATIKTAGVLTNGAWGVGVQNGSYGAYITASGGLGTNLFILANDANGVNQGDSVAFTPVINTTYLIICEFFPLNPLLGPGYELRGYLVDPVTNAMLTRPLKANVGTVNLIASPFQPGISTAPASTSEEWDNFYAIDYSDAAEYIEVGAPGGTLVLDASRRTSRFTPNTTGAQSVDGSQYLSTPTDVPLGWVDLCAGQGPGCLQVWGDDTTLYGATVSVAFQQRQR